MYQAQRYFRALELDKVLSKLSDQANCDDSKRLALQLTPSDDYFTVRSLMQKTSDAYMLSARYTSPAFHKLKNCSDALRKAQKGSDLSLRELMDASSLLHNIRSVKDWRKRCEGEKTSLDPLFEVLVPNKELENLIDGAVVSEEELADSASSELANLRRKINAAKLRVRERLDQLIKSPTQSKYLQDALVTMRDGRFVVPVKSEYRSEIKGLVHDTSASGATIFIEPMAVVEANNEIRVLQAQEKREIERIIHELSQRVGDFAESMVESYKALVEIDLYFAKAALAYKMKATVPKLVDNGQIDLKKARHPLIDPQKVVPIDVNLGIDFNTLVITGPNTGGKTVTLKTVGLLTLMAMCGLMLPVAEGSVISVYKKVLVDIGDEQSIEQSLSTFSSHMTNIARILRTADEKSLIMLDELCSGTDPVEGSALAVSILDEFRKRDCKVIATTHYQEVKMYAIKTDNVENASCEFDIKTLRPTYRVIVGMPGKSNAFAISSKLGISSDIIDNAKELVSTEDKRFEEVVQSLEKTRQELEKLKSSAAAEQKKSKEITEQLKAERDQLEKDKEKELQDVRSKAASIIEEVRFQGDLMLEELERLRKQKESADFAQKVKGARSHINSSVNAMYDTANPIMQKKIDHYVLPRPLKVGDTVRLADLNKEGTLLRLPDSKNMCFVQVGAMKTKTKLENLRLVEEKKESKKQPTPSKVGKKLVSNFSRKSGMELDIRGMLGDDGVMEVDRFIDSCLLSGISVITIIHGKGTGALRSAVQQYLRKNPHVKSFRDGAYGEGEAGVTVAELE